MATMISEVYDALLASGAPEDKARKAAEALAGYENRFTRLETEIVKLQGEVSLLKWMVGFNLAMSAGILARLFVVS